MKDKQTEAASGQPRIPLISAVLHSAAMPAVVFLRSSFGFAYLRPKSVFFAFTWAFTLFLIYAWNEPRVWREYGAVGIFGFGAAILYWLHLLIAFTRELYRAGEHDHYSGTSHLLRIGKIFGASGSNQEMNIHLWAEPGLILAISIVLRILSGDRHLSKWLAYSAVSLWFKEAFNYWSHLRQQKRQADMFDDTDETVDRAVSSGDQASPKAARTQKQKRLRNLS